MSQTRLVTLLTFSTAFEASYTVGLLESNGITCFLKDSLAIQISKHSRAIGGVKLQIFEADTQKALAVLKENGYLTPRVEQEPTALQKAFDKGTSNIPLLKKLSVEHRLYVLLAITVVTITSTILYLLIPLTYDRLVANSWCVSHIEYEGKSYTPHTTGIALVIPGICTESLSFDESSTVQLPGINTPVAQGTWHITENNLVCIQADTLSYVYNKCYKATFSGSGGSLMLTSNTTVIHCYVKRY
ncbi:MAG: DUF2007 domain-containing protein [Bacteroidetes bacterium]|nr:MAG: DUF2007 domain-containing protein [Bacteroidota bacterium]